MSKKKKKRIEREKKRNENKAIFSELLGEEFSKEDLGRTPQSSIPRIPRFQNEWFRSGGSESIKGYLRKVYPTKEERKKMENVFNDRKTFSSFADKKLIWNYMLWKYGVWKPHLACVFPLINADDLTELVCQLDESVWKNVEMMKRFGLGEPGKDFYLHLINDKYFRIIDNLSNQILTRCTIVVNRLTHGIDRVSEKEIMKLAFVYQNCFNVPAPKAVNENNKDVLEQQAQRALKGDKEILQRLQDLPYLNPKFKIA